MERSSSRWVYARETRLTRRVAADVMTTHVIRDSHDAGFEPDGSQLVPSYSNLAQSRCIPSASPTLLLQCSSNNDCQFNIWSLEHGTSRSNQLRQTVLRPPTRFPFVPWNRPEVHRCRRRRCCELPTYILIRGVEPFGISRPSSTLASNVHMFYVSI